MIKKSFLTSIISILLCFTFAFTASAISVPRLDDIETDDQNCYNVMGGNCTLNGNTCYRQGRYFGCTETVNVSSLPPDTRACVLYLVSNIRRSTDQEDFSAVTSSSVCANLPRVNTVENIVPGSTETESNNSNTPAEFTSDCRQLLGLTSWDCGVNISSEDTLVSGIWQIVLNVLTNISIIAAYLVLGYVIYGGYLYTMSGGSADKIMSGKKTITRAFIGLGIIALANLIMNTIRFVLIGANNNLLDCATTECVNPTNMISGAIQWTIGIVGVVAVIFVVYGGISFMTSAGDPGKVKKAKDMILYSTIGIIVVTLAEIITAFVTNIIN